ncbi:MAG: adenylyltransferase/cytidyltransferase family protein, partial [archaeon]
KIKKFKINKKQLIFMFKNIKSKILKKEELKEFKKLNNDKKIIFCTGCFDILQVGHALFFNQCKSLGDILVVGVGSDNVINELKGNDRPINNELNRLYLVSSLEDVDHVILNEKKVENGIDFKEIIEKIKPDKLVLNNDDVNVKHKYELCKKLNIELKILNRETLPELEATSTTKIIEKIRFVYKSPLRIDFSGGWTDIPNIMDNKIGFVSNMAIKPHISLKEGNFNFNGYPRGSGLSTSTASEALKMISSKSYNIEGKTLKNISEDLFKLENKELNWIIGRQDQYSIVYGNYNCFEFGNNYGKRLEININKNVLEKFKKKLLLLHTGISRNSQAVVKEVYNNYKTESGQKILKKLSQYGKSFSEYLQKENFLKCSHIMNENFKEQKKLAKSTSNELLDEIYDFSLKNGALGGKLCVAGGGGAFIFYCENKENLLKELKYNFPKCFEIPFEIEYENIKKLNNF